MNDVARKLARQLNESKDKLISDEITRFIGGDWSIDDLKCRCEVLNMPDGSEVFTIDKVELIQFFKPEHSVNANGLSYSASTNQSYKLLNKGEEDE